MMRELSTINYLKKEYKELNLHPLSNIGCTLGLINNDDLFHWRISLLGPKDSVYAGGLYFLNADFDEHYPDTPPNIRFITKIYHLNISPIDGEISLSTLCYWVPKTPMKEVLYHIFILFYEQNPGCSFKLQMAEEFKTDRNEFNRKAKKKKKKYASIKIR